MPQLPRYDEAVRYYTPLHTAAKAGDIPTMEKALFQNPDHLNHRYNDSEQTPLLYAAAHQQWDAVRWLLKQPNVWLDCHDQDERSILFYAIKK